MLSTVWSIISGAGALFVIAWLFGFAPFETYDLKLIVPVADSMSRS